jgi:hypothetical protein
MKIVSYDQSVSSRLLGVLTGRLALDDDGFVLAMRVPAFAFLSRLHPDFRRKMYCKSAEGYYEVTESSLLPSEYPVVTLVPVVSIRERARRSELPSPAERMS